MRLDEAKIGTHVQYTYADRLVNEIGVSIGTIIDVKLPFGVQVQFDDPGHTVAWGSPSEFTVAEARYHYHGVDKTYGRPALEWADATGRREAWANVWDLRDTLDLNEKIRIGRVVTTEYVDEIVCEICADLLV